MSSRRAKRGRGGVPGQEVTKEEYAVAKFLRSKVPTKTTTLCGMRVEYFVGSKAIDALLASQWGEKCKRKESKLFETREDAVAYCQKLLDKKEIFHRARKIVQNKKDEEEEAASLGGGGGEEKPRRRKKAKEAPDSPEATASAPEVEGAGKKSRKKKKDSPPEDAAATDEPASAASAKKSGKKKREEEEEAAGEGTPVAKEKKKKRIKLDMHEDQTFVDGNEAYVWIYDPIRPTTFIFGLALVVGAIAVCLFPLWPEWMRVGAYYLSLLAAGLLGVILALSIFRYVLYALVWVATLGKVQFFLLPNLTEDVGFFESFVPVYELETNWGNETDECEKKKKKKRKKAKDSEAEDADSDGGRKSPEPTTTPGEAPDDDEEDDDDAGGGDGAPSSPEMPADPDEISPGADDAVEENVLDDDDADDPPSGAALNDDADDPPSGAASTSGSDADYEIISHGDLNNGEKLTPS